MKKPFSLLSRLFARKPTGFVADLHSRAIGVPLFIEPSRGSTLISGFLRPDAVLPKLMMDDGESESGDRVIQMMGNGVAVLNISGPLVSRGMGGPCGWGPISYEEIACALDCIEADMSIQDVVFRFDSPGGEGGRLFDLADRIYQMGATRRTHAVADDMAFSAAYGLFSACRNRCVSRTGGVGSVGVVACHIDQSGWDAQIGAKYEYVYAGARKIDGNPHEALSPEARTTWQTEIDRLNGIFVATVARNLGLKPEAVAATEAGLFFGQSAVDAGFATRVGTFDDLMMGIMGGTMECPPMSASAGESEEDDDSEPGESDPNDNPQAPDVDQAQRKKCETETMSAQALVRLAVTECQSAGLSPELATAVLHTSPLTDAEAIKLDVGAAAEIAGLCLAAGVSETAAAHVRTGLSVDQVRAKLADAKAAADEANINTRLAADQSPDPKAQSAAGWDRAFSKIRRLK